MSHWYTQDRLASEHRADLDREADRRAIGRLAARSDPTRSFDRILLALRNVRRRRLEAELLHARRQVEALERALGYAQSD